MAEKTLEEIRKDILEYIKVQLGPVYKDSDEQVLKNLCEVVELEAMNVANIITETPAHLINMMSLVIACTVIAYQNRGVEGQYKQSELGQESHFLDWHTYLQEQVVKHGKRYVI